MLNQMKSRLPKPPHFLLCILPERKNSDLYGPWKKKFLSDLGVINQCIAPMNMKKVNDQYLTNVALKINAKVGGLNSVLSMDFAHRIPKISMKPTIIIGMDVSHGSPGHADSPSISAWHGGSLYNSPSTDPSSNARFPTRNKNSSGLVLSTDPKPRLRWTADLHEIFSFM